ncbi:hypothetical protein EK21DRAFT_82528 [Setomelanomma holmii]|uniref:20S-pre-rRNA D-site endonuclease NOB1 n=1 Tax=Setomelanomma holmii TaxID=210430 RepID=A0A9P4LE10_9PLEO|nr:hypothetical protein EK21DRAFT_82528 [Setomelanomma holmii]
MATDTTKKPIHSLILDTGPLIKNAVSISTIINSAEEIYTTSAILSEIRDEATRSRVQTQLMPFLKVRNPTPASYEAVIAFSKKTGDYSVLSIQDLGILALAYEVHCESNGGNWGLREAPKQAIKMRPGEEITTPAKSKKNNTGGASESGSNAQNEAKEQSGTAQPEQGVEPSESQPSQNVATDSPDPQAASTLETQVNTQSIPNTTQLSEDLSTLNITTPPSPPATDDSDSDGEWITPSNLSSRKAKDAGLDTNSSSSSQTQMDIATMTIDFAMQSVLLQMNLNLLSTNMQRIKHLTSKVLRCHACFHIERNLTKQFCPRCGGTTLKRVSCSTNSKGEFQIHLAKNYQHNKRGDRYSVPKPIAGTANGKWSGQGGGQGGWGRDLILTEDQKEYQRSIEEGRRKGGARDLMDDDYLPGILTGDRGGRAGGRVKVGAGKNVNSKKRF